MDKYKVFIDNLVVNPQLECVDDGCIKHYGIDTSFVKCEVSQLEQGKRIKVIINGANKIQVKSLTLKLMYHFKKDEKVFINGYQSWTDSKEVDINYRLRGLNGVPSFVVNKYQFDKYGDYWFKNYQNKKGVFHSYTYSYIRQNNDYLFFGSLNDDKYYTIYDYNTNINEMVISSDLNEIHSNTSIVALDFILIYGNGEVFEAYKQYFPKLKNYRKLNGFTSWYKYYQNINEKIILNNIESAAMNKFDLFQIDDGYQTHVGDWLDIDVNKFPNGLDNVAKTIHDKSMLSGIWLAPFVCDKKSRIIVEHPEYIARDKDMKMIEGGSNWGGFYCLDFEKEEVKDYLRRVFKYYIEDLKIDLFKLDFLYAVTLKPNPYKSRAQVMYEANQFLRECIGSKLILGCGVMLASCFNLFDYCRIGCDVSLIYDDVWYMKAFHRERISTKNCLSNTIYRRQLDGLGFLNDPDVFMLRNTDNKLTSDQRKLLTFVNHLFGSLLLTSDDFQDYSDEQKSLLQEARALEDAKVVNVYCKMKNMLVVEYILKGKENNMIIDLEKGIITNG